MDSTNKMIEEVKAQLPDTFSIEEDKKRLDEMMQRFEDKYIDISNDVKNLTNMMNTLNDKQITISAENVQINIK